MPNRDNIEQVIELASSQWGLFTTAQALAAGASRTQLSRLAANGRIESTSYGVYRMADGEETQHAATKAAWLSIFPKETAYDRLRSRPRDAIVTGRTAACLHGDTELRESPFTFAVSSSKRTARKDIELHPWPIDERDVVIIEGLPTASVERTISDLVRSNEDPSLVGNFITGVCRRGHIIDEARLAELLSPLSSRNGFKKDDGASFARKLVSDFADAVQMQLVADSFMRALEASPSYQQIADQMAKLAQAFASSIPTFELPDYSQLPAMKAMTQLQEAFEPLAQFSDRITDRLRETLQITAALTPHVANLQSLKDGGPIDEVQDSEGT